METENTIDLSEARQFTRNLFYNISVYYLQKKSGMIQEFSFCKFYSHYGHTVITHYLELNDGIFDQVEKDYVEIWNNTDLKEKGELLFEQWQEIDNFPSDSEWYIYFAKTAILAMFEPIYDSSKFDMYEEKVTKLADEAIKKNILRENYDIPRIKCKSIVNAVYEWFGADLIDFATEPDIKHGWDEGNLLTNSTVYLNSKGTKLLGYWTKFEYYKVMDKTKFVTLLHYMQSAIQGNNVTVDKISKFILNASLLSLHCCLHCNFPQSVEIVVDILSRRLNLI